MGKYPPITIEGLGYLAAERADMLKDDGTGGQVFADSIIPEAIYIYVNLECSALWNVLVNAHEDYCVYREFINVKAGQEDYLLPVDFYKFRKIFPVMNGKRGRALRKFNLEKLGQADSLSAILTSPIEETQYRITGHRLWLHPTPTSDVTEGLELWYVPDFKFLENAKDLLPLQFPNGWEEYIIEGTAARILEKVNLDGSPYRARQKEVLQRILIMSEDRDVGEPHQMQDTEGYLSGREYD
jgi:hypothetical protein